ncbi:MAG: TylF/MycF/NovP-related O-methyltransferase, partial [Rhodospirillales bacterium]|nr:TylF/MycF/NovP-related O-methyltransferase [Rhodospirillales bacterium]
MVQASLKKLAYRFGYDFTMRKLPQYDTMRRRLGIPRDMDPAFADICEKAAPFTMTSVERMYALYEGVKHVVARNVPGDLVECGVWQGGSSMVMALTLAALGDTSRKIHLYDTFAGMTRPGEVDRRARDGAEQISRWQYFQRGDHNEWCYASLAEVRTNMA